MELSKTEITELENQLIEGIRKSDLPFLNHVLHDDLLFLAPGGKPITKAMDLASHEAGDMVVEHLTATIEDIRVTGDTAVALVVYDTKGTMLGNPIQGLYRYIRVWKYFPDGPKIIAGSCFSL